MVVNGTGTPLDYGHQKFQTVGVVMSDVVVGTLEDSLGPRTRGTVRITQSSDPPWILVLGVH